MRAAPPVEFVGPSGLPWSDDALAFHRLGSLGHGAEASRKLSAMAGSTLKPASSRVRSQDVGLGDLDRSFGDDRYVFFSLCAPVGGEPALEPEDDRQDWHHRAALAYRIADLMALGRVGWRPHDLIHVYEEYVTFRRAAGARRSVAARCTVSSRRDVLRLSALCAAALRWASDRGRVGELEREAAASSSLGVDWGAPFEPPSSSRDVEDSWPEVLGVGPQPELVVLAEVPVASAAYHYDAGARVWRPGPPRGG